MANKLLIKTLLLNLIFIIILPISTNAVYNVVTFGAKSNVKIDSTYSFMRAWSAACKSSKPAKILVPRGRYLIRKIVFNGPCRNKIIFQIDGTLVAPKNYWIIGNSWDWILFNSVRGLSIYGGTIDGRASNFWACKKAHRNCPKGARSISFNNAKDVVISGLTSRYSQGSHMTINGCNNIMIRYVNIIAPSQSPNTDGINIQSSTGVTITDSIMQTGDDCVSIGPGTKKLLVQRVRCGPGHGISIGSLAREYNEEGVEDITVKNVVFIKSDNGVRIKSWARPSNGYVKGVLYQNLVMNNVQNPIIIDQRYCPGDIACPNQRSGIKISGVTYQNVRGTSSSEAAVSFMCSSSNPCSGIKLQNVKLKHPNTPAKSICWNAYGYTTGSVSPGSCLWR